jgi:hypothetical protein
MEPRARALVSQLMPRRALAILLLAGLAACAPAAVDVPVVTAVIETPRPPPGVDPFSPEERLLALLTLDNPRIGQVAFSLAHLGDPSIRREAAQRLVSLARAVLSPAWRPEGAPEIAGLALERARTKALEPVLAAMADLGGRSVVDLAFAVADDDRAPRARRLQALQVLERTIPADDTAAAERRARIAGSLPSPVRPASIVGHLRRAARACYQRALARDPAFPAQKAILHLRFGEDGSVDVSVGGDLEEDLRRCLQHALGGLQADGEPEGPTDLVVPISFIRS